jgi:hypothetical protein
MAVTYTGTRPAPFVSAAVQEYQSNELTAFRGLEIAKTFNSMTDKGTLPVVTREGQAGTGDGNTRRSPGSAYNRDDIEAEGVSFQCLGYGHETPLPDEDVAMYKSEFDAQVVAGVRNRVRILTDLEVKIKNMALNTTTFNVTDGNFIDNKAAPWATAGSDILGQVDAGIDAMLANGGLPNSIVIPRLLAKYLKTNTAIKAMLSGIAYPTLDQVAEVLRTYWNIPNIVFPGAVYNSAKKGQTASMTDIWGDTYVNICRIAQGESPSESCAFRTPIWQEMSGADVAIKTYREEQTDSTIVKGKMFYDELVVDKFQGYLMQVKA